MGRKGLLLCVAVALLASCASRTPAPIVDRSRQSEYAFEESTPVCAAASEEEFCHVVVKGDTLYAISRKYDVKVVEIASRNNVRAPFIIKPGEYLIVRDITKELPSEPNQVTEKETPPTTQQAAPRPTKQVTIETTDTAPSGTTPTPKRSSAVSEKAVETLPPPSMKTRDTPTYTGWQWPVPYEPTRGEGTITALDYVLNDGVEVLSASAGKVIYAGAGLNKFKHLVIIDTGTRHLVAYEFNTDHAIREGQLLKLGQLITRIVRPAGVTNDQGRYRQFHFEIWANGKPLNPNQVIGVVAAN